MHASLPVPSVAQELLTLLDRFEGREVLRRLDEPHDGGALAPASAGLLRARALASLERFVDAYNVLGEVKALRDLEERHRVEAQMLTARMLRVASPRVDEALGLAMAAADSATRIGGDLALVAVEARMEAALLFARKRCRKLAERELDRAAALEVALDRVHAVRAEVAIQFDERAAAKQSFEAALAVGGEGVRRGQLGLARLHTILGEFDNAQRAIDALGERPLGDLAFWRVQHRLRSAQAKWSEVAGVIEKFLEASPEADAARSLRLERASAFYKAGDLDRARLAWAELAEAGDDWASRSASRTLAKLAKADAKRTRLNAFPSVAQLRNHCGPASVELCMRFFGTTADQVQVAREIKHPDGGTPVHKMRSYMEQAGFVARRVEADLPKLRAILDAGVPVIIEEDYSTTRHVAVAIGYDDRREILEVQDPMTHEVRETPYEELEKLREFSNHGALVAVPKDRSDLLQKLDACGAVECAYITKTDLAWEAHDQERFEDADRLATEAIEMHEAYELAWVYRFVRARDRFAKESSDENRDAMGAVINEILRLWPEDEWPQQFLGRAFVLEERWDEALPAYERARDRDPDDANNWSAIGDCQVELGQRDAARTSFEEALRRDPGHIRANENLANIALDAGDVTLANVLNECARELHPENPFNHHVHGRILAKRSDARGAAAAYAAALELAPSSQYYLVERARYLAKAGAVDEALASLEKACEGVKDAYLPVQLADLAYENDRIDQCLKACAMVSEIDASSPTPLAISGAAYTKRGELDKGLELLRSAIKRRPTYAWAFREMGRALSRAGRHDDALAASAASVGLNSSALATFYLGETLANGGHGEDALSYLRRAAGYGELGERELSRCGEVIRNVEGAGSAHRFFGELGDKFPRDTNVLRAHVKLLLESLWYPSTAAPILTKLAELEPDDPFVLANAGHDLMDESIAAEAKGEELLRKAVASAPDATMPRRLFARALNERGRFAEALEVLEPCRADEQTMEDRVTALIGLGREGHARAAVDAFVGNLPEEVRGKVRRPLDFRMAKAARRFEEALAIGVALSEDSGELDDDGELSRWESERFECLVALGRGEEAYEFGSAQCADAEDRGRLAYDALAHDQHEIAAKLASEALEEDEDEIHALHVKARLAELEGQTAEAKKIWERMREISEWHIHVENLGRLALSAGDVARAKDLIEESVSTGHVCPVSLELRAELRLLTGDREGARADAERARACLQLELRSVSEQLDGLVLGLDGKADEARAAFEKYLKREKLSKADMMRFTKIREALGC